MLFCDLETERLLLKNISTEDTEFIYSQFSDSTVNRYLFDAEPLVDIKGAEEIIDLFVQPEPRGQHRWIMIRKSDGEKIGTCGFHCWDFNNSRIDVGYDLKERFWGNGYMQEAMREILLFARDRMHIKEVNACIYKDNIRSIHLAEKNGFVKSGEYNETFRGEEYLHYRYTLKLSASEL